MLGGGPPGPPPCPPPSEQASGLGGRGGGRGACAHVVGLGGPCAPRRRGVLHPGRQCRAKCRASRKDEVDKGPADIGLQKK